MAEAIFEQEDKRLDTSELGSKMKGGVESKVTDVFRDGFFDAELNRREALLLGNGRRPTNQMQESATIRDSHIDGRDLGTCQESSNCVDVANTTGFSECRIKGMI